MLSPSELGWDIALYAHEWLSERSRLAMDLAGAVAERTTEKRVHDLRVACRRLREAIAFFEGVPGAPRLAELDRAARKMANSIGRLREIDVALKRLRALETKRARPTGHSKDIASLVRTLQEKRRKLARKNKDK